MHTQKYYCNATFTQYVYINIQVNQNATCGLSKKYPNVSYNILNNTILINHNGRTDYKKKSLIRQQLIQIGVVNAYKIIFLFNNTYFFYFREDKI